MVLWYNTAVADFIGNTVIRLRDRERERHEEKHSRKSIYVSYARFNTGSI